MKVALVHDWLTGMRGGERVLDALLDIFPDAEIFTLLHVPGSVSQRIESRPVHTSFIQAVPGAARHYRRLLPLFPRAITSVRIDGFDLVVSSSHCVAKGVHIEGRTPHLCYSHTPMRYVWDQQEAYTGGGRAGLLTRAALAAFAPSLRRWDVRTAANVDRFVANSRHVGERIRRYYGREATVVHPPVELDRFRPADRKEDFYLVLGAPAPYKRIDRALEAFRGFGRRLVVAGEGVPALFENGSGAGRATGPTRIELMDRLTDAEVADVLGRARALIMPGVEDFGITAVEALASGTPVIALGEGGVLDTILPVGSGNADANGVFFEEASAAGLRDAVLRFERHAFDPHVVAATARPFSRERFVRAMRAEVDRLAHRGRAPRSTR